MTQIRQALIGKVLQRSQYSQVITSHNHAYTKKQHTQYVMQQRCEPEVTTTGGDTFVLDTVSVHACFCVWACVFILIRLPHYQHKAMRALLGICAYALTDLAYMLMQHFTDLMRLLSPTILSKKQKALYVLNENRPALKKTCALPEARRSLYHRLIS